ncbi:MAG: T9SS type A sorting domain-containing protein [Saprospirales bacterium]|nr:T9SS type A sorting domain-containing protein [Saprospirales bacterium]
MKKQTFTFLLLSFFSFTLQAQYGGNTLALNGFDYVTVPDNSNGSLDIANGFSIEVWVKLSNSLNDQKIVSKADVTLTNAYIFGVENGLVKFEVFDDAGVQTLLHQGTVDAGVWVHLAGTYTIGGFMRIYINGELAGETAASAGAHSYTLNNLIVGAASWDPIYFPVTGNIDEVRFYQEELSQQTIRDWMLLYVNDTHPNYAALTVYLKSNEGSGTTVSSETGQNGGTHSNGSGWAASTAPFKGDFLFFPPDHALGGIWPGHAIASADLLTLENAILGGDQSIIFGDDTYGYDFFAEAPTGYDKSLAKVWRTAVQGPTAANASFDLTPIDLTMVEEVVLLESDDYEFSVSSVISGTWAGNTFTSPSVQFKNNFYYTLGFKQMSSATNEKGVSKFALEATPNPSSGPFLLNWNEDVKDARVLVQDLNGRTILEQAAGNGMQMEMNLSHLPAGLYLVRLSTAEQSAVCRVQKQ